MVGGRRWLSEAQTVRLLHTSQTRRSLHHSQIINESAMERQTYRIGLVTNNTLMLAPRSGRCLYQQYVPKTTLE